MAFDPTAPVASSDSPGTGTNVTLADDTLFGVGAKLGKIPVKIATGSPRTKAQQAEYAAGGQAGSGAPTAYAENAQLVPYESALALFYNMAPDERAAVQQKLLDGGFYAKGFYSRTNPDTYTPGMADADSFAAYSKAVQQAARSNQSVSDIITSSADARNQAQAAAGPAKAIVQLTNPVDLRRVATDTARKVLGRNPDPAFVDNFVAAYHAAETSQGNQQAAASQMGGSVVAPPNAAALAEEELRQQNPADAFAHDVAGEYQDFSKMIGTPGGGQ